MNLVGTELIAVARNQCHKPFLDSFQTAEYLEIHAYYDNTKPKMMS